MPGCKILKKDYFLKITGILFKINVNKEKNLDNLKLIYIIYKAIKRLILNIIII